MTEHHHSGTTKKSWSVLLGLLAATLLSGCEIDLSGSTTTDSPSADRATVTRVIDGDTIEVRTDGRTEKVRVLGIDTPETHGGTECGGPEATAVVTDHWEGRKVTLVRDSRADDTDRYDRLLRHVQDNGPTPGNLAHDVVTAGWAIAYHPDSEPAPDGFTELQRLQEIAESEGAGAWGTGCQMSPARP